MNTSFPATAKQAEQDEQPDSGPQQSRPAKSKKSASAFKTISEVADGLGVQQHVLRFWETKFSQVRPLKRGGGRRYYRPEDVDLLKTIHHLLYTEGYTIKGVQKLLKERGKNRIVKDNIARLQAPAVAPVQPEGAAVSQKVEAESASKYKAALEAMLEELKELRKMVKPEE